MQSSNISPRNQPQSPNNQPPPPFNRSSHYNVDKPKPHAETPAISLSARWQVLMARRLPWQLDPEEAAIILGFKNRETILQLEKLDLLKALGNPEDGCDRYFSLVDIDALGADPQRLHEARKRLREARQVKEAAARKAKEAAARKAQSDKGRAKRNKTKP